MDGPFIYFGLVIGALFVRDGLKKVAAALATHSDKEGGE